MKKIIAVLLLAFALIFAAGCVAEDPYVGTWTASNTNGNGVTETVTQEISADGTGFSSYVYSDGNERKYPALWEAMDDGRYIYGEYNYAFSLSEDEKILTDLAAGTEFTLIEGEGLGEGMYQAVYEDGDAAAITLRFDADGSGTITFYPRDSDEADEEEIVWLVFSDTTIVWDYPDSRPYTNDGRLDFGNNIYLTNEDGRWIESPATGTYRTEAAVYGDILYAEWYVLETEELGYFRTYQILSDEEAGMELLYLYGAVQEIQEDGTLLCDCGDIFTKVTA